MARIADVLTWFRLVAAPIAALTVLMGAREQFVALIILSLASDLLDGPIARRFGKGSGAGARLDTVADGGTVLAALLGVVVFEGDNLQPEMPWLIVFLASYAAAALVALLKFRALPAYHLYTAKAAQVGAGVFFVWLFLLGYSPLVFLAALALGILANAESLIVTLTMRRFRTDVGSLLHILGPGRDR